MPRRSPRSSKICRLSTRRARDKETAPRCHLTHATDEGRGLAREIIGEALERAEGWEVRGQPRRHELKDALRPP
jgi:hypothetical protein